MGAAWQVMRLAKPCLCGEVGVVRQAVCVLGGFVLDNRVEESIVHTRADAICTIFDFADI